MPRLLIFILNSWVFKAVEDQIILINFTDGQSVNSMITTENYVRNLTKDSKANWL